MMAKLLHAPKTSASSDQMVELDDEFKFELPKSVVFISYEYTKLRITVSNERDNPNLDLTLHKDFFKLKSAFPELAFAPLK